jgi:hypothetical protein
MQSYVLFLKITNFETKKVNSFLKKTIEHFGRVNKRYVRITVLSLDDAHYGNKKSPFPFVIAVFFMRLCVGSAGLAYFDFVIQLV